MFTGKIELPKIALDLVEVSGGGSCPSQFYGTASDGEEIYIRYRGGGLSISKDGVGGKTLYSETFGPRYHGDILMEQVCELTGITIKGENVQASPADFERAEANELSVRDFSGLTLYWDRYCHCSRTGLSPFVEKITQHYPDAFLLEFRFGGAKPETCVIERRRHLAECDGFSNFVAIARNEHQLRDALRLRGRDALRTALASMRHVITLSHPWRAQLQSSDLSSDDMLIHDYDHRGRKVLFGGAQSSLRANFPANDAAYRDFMVDVNGIFDECFANEIEIIDLQSGKKIRDDCSRDPYSPDLAMWCRSSNDRFLGMHESHKSAYRPRQGPNTPLS